MIDSTSIADRRGAALYLLHDGSMTQQRRFEVLAAEVRAAQPEAQIVLLSIRSQDGEKVRDFYDIRSEQLPTAMIVRDDDQLAGLYVANELPPANQIAYTLGRVG